MVLSTSRLLARWEHWVYYNDIHVESIIQLGFFVAVTARVQLLSQDKFVLNSLINVHHIHVHWAPRSHYTLFHKSPSPLVAYM